MWINNDPCLIGGGAGQQERLEIGGFCSSWDDVKLSPLTCMSLAMELAFVRRIGFRFVFVFASDPAAYGAEEIASLDAVPTLVFRLGSCLVHFDYPMQGGVQV